MDRLNLVQKYDNVLPQSNMVIHKIVTFKNHLGTTLAADVYTLKNYAGK